jgi:signal transduction histidine kinase
MGHVGLLIRFLKRHPREADLVLALALAALVQVEVWTSDGYLAGSKWVYVPAGLVMTVPLAWRRRVPLAVVTIVMAAQLVQSILVSPTPTPDSSLAAWVVAVYSVAAHSELHRALAGGGIALGAWLAWIGPDDFLLPLVGVGGSWLAGRLVRERQLLAAALEARTAALEREQEETARLAVTEERARIARELHDVVAHSVSTMVLQAGAERVALEDGQRSTREALRSIEEIGRQALAEMRRLVGVLRKEDEAVPLAPHPSLALLEPLVGHVRDAGLPVELRVLGERRPLPPGLDISAYRIVQEALTNVLKHAGPAHARVLVRYGDRELEIEVADDGRGPNSSGASGHGLVGMRERVALFGGELETGRGERSGFVVRVRLPLETPSS